MTKRRDYQVMISYDVSLDEELFVFSFLTKINVLTLKSREPAKYLSKQVRIAIKSVAIEN